MTSRARRRLPPGRDVETLFGEGINPVNDSTQEKTRSELLLRTANAASLAACQSVRSRRSFDDKARLSDPADDRMVVCADALSSVHYLTYGPCAAAS